jgi:hypothetical protein
METILIEGSSVFVKNHKIASVPVKITGLKRLRAKTACLAGTCVLLMMTDPRLGKTAKDQSP